MTEHCDFFETGSECHQFTYLSKNEMPQIIQLNSLPLRDRTLLKFRFRKMEDPQTICKHHKQVYLTYFEKKVSRNCCDVFKIHAKPVKGTRKITLCQAEKYKELQLIPGNKLCPKCLNKLHSCDLSSTSGLSGSGEEFEDVENLNKSLIAMGESPINKKRSFKQRIQYGKRKIENLTSTATKKVCKVLQIDLESAGTSKVTGTKNNAKFLQDDFKILFEKLRDKFQHSRSRELRYQILTLAPSSWTVQETMEYFGATRYSVLTSRNLAQHEGVLAKPTPKVGHPIKEDDIKLVQDFYEDPDISRCCPGAKDTISLKTGSQRKAKHLMLVEVKEAYSLYCQKHPNSSIGRSSFAALRPKWCVLPGSSGTHNICVCTYHQNVKLMLQAAGIKLDYKHLMAKIVCNIEADDCMLGQCNLCPGEESLLNWLNQQEIFENLDTITFKQWVYVDRTTFATLVEPVEDFKNLLVEKLSALTKHHFISKAQSAYLKSVKLQLPTDTVVCLVDFAENYSFLKQDAAQGFHWDISQATLHPFVLYYRPSENSNVTHISYAVISDVTIHDNATFYVFQQYIVKEIKKELSNINMIHYFSDGAASQYKNKKNFVNLCHHELDFGLKAVWNFFGTSHGKSPCDGIGGVVKSMAAKASIRGEDILTPKDLYQWACKNINGIKFFYISADTVTNVTETILIKRYSNAATVPGTRSAHCFIPIDTSHLKMSM